MTPLERLLCRLLWRLLWRRRVAAGRAWRDAERRDAAARSEAVRRILDQAAQLPTPRRGWR